MKTGLLINIQNRFNAVEFAFAHKNTDYIVALNQYLEYIAQSPELGEILKSILMKELIPSNIVEHIFMHAMIPFSTNVLEEVSMPSFWDNKIESKYKLVENFLKTMQEDNKEYNLDVAKRGEKEILFELEKRRSTFSVNDNEVLQLKMLNNYLIEALTENSHKIRSIKFYQTTNERGVSLPSKIEIDGKEILVQGKRTTLHKLFKIWYERGLNFQTAEKRRQFLMTLSNPNSALAKLKYNKNEIKEMFTLFEEGGLFKIKFNKEIEIK